MEIEKIEEWLSSEAHDAEKMCEKLQYRWIYALWGGALFAALASFLEGWWKVGSIFVMVLLLGQSIRDIFMSCAMLQSYWHLKSEYLLLRLRNSK